MLRLASQVARSHKTSASDYENQNCFTTPFLVSKLVKKEKERELKYKGPNVMKDR